MKTRPLLYLISRVKCIHLIHEQRESTRNLRCRVDKEGMSDMDRENLLQMLGVFIPVLGIRIKCTDSVGLVSSVGDTRSKSSNI